MSTSTSNDERLSYKNCTPHFHDWKLWSEPEDDIPNYCDALDCPTCFSPLRPIQLICPFNNTWWVVCPECHTKYQRYIPDEVSRIEADSRDELIIAMWSRIQQLEQRVQELEKQYTPTHTNSNNSSNLDYIGDLPKRYQSLLRSK